MTHLRNLSTPGRLAAGRLLFVICRPLVRASGRLLGREHPLGHVLDDLAESLYRV